MKNAVINYKSLETTISLRTFFIIFSRNFVSCSSPNPPNATIAISLKRVFAVVLFSLHSGYSCCHSWTWFKFNWAILLIAHFNFFFSWFSFSHVSLSFTYTVSRFTSVQCSGRRSSSKRLNSLIKIREIPSTYDRRPVV